MAFWAYHQFHVRKYTKEMFVRKTIQGGMLLTGGLDWRIKREVLGLHDLDRMQNSTPIVPFATLPVKLPMQGTKPEKSQSDKFVDVINLDGLNPGKSVG